MKEFKKDEEEIKMEEIMEEEHVKFTNKAKWTRPKPKINLESELALKKSWDSMEFLWNSMEFDGLPIPWNSMESR